MKRTTKKEVSIKHITVDPIGAPLGAQITGIDLSGPLPTETVSEIRRAFLDHLLLLFPDQDISPEAFKTFGENFGTLNIHPFLPNREDLPEVMVLDKTPERETNVGNGWHSDMTFLAEPPLGSILHAHILPPVGGDTLFRNMYLVYESLSEGMKKMLESLTAIHDYTIIFLKSAQAGRTRLSEEKIMAAREEYPLVEHPVVRTHPETGRKLL
ncbi:MAG: TauD/TfdA family dioxygenase, partial [bacterium]|nr:TauD/TfdA family dioxygenase [bacterium]